MAEYSPNMRSGGGVVALGTVIAVLACPAPAAAQFGLWSQPQGIAVSPDNRHVYVGASVGTLALTRDAATGALAEVGRFTGTRGPLEVSPDGASVYAGAGGPGAPIVTAFSRDAVSGALRPVSVSGSGPALGVADIAVSTDSGTVYATGAGGDELAIFSRDASDGSLSFSGNAPHAPGVAHLMGMAVSPDGHWLYAAGLASEGGGRVVRFERLPGGGLAVAQVADCGPCYGETVALSPVGWLYASGMVAVRWDSATGELGAPGNSPLMTSGGSEPGGSSIAVAGDGMLYTADTWGQRLFQVRPLTDGYEVVRSYREDQDGVRGLRDLRSVVIAQDGRHVYVAAGRNSPEVPGTVATFTRDPASGQLTFSSLFTGGPQTPPMAVTINGGDEYTRNPHVLVRVSGGLPHPQLEFANDGGFVDSRLFGAQPDSVYAWTLASTGPERLPKTVYVRGAWEPGHGGSWRGEPVSDTIVLDETRPVVLGARRVGAQRLRVRARDRLSGVRRLQIARNRRVPGRWRAYEARRVYPVARGRVWVRAGDRAGNRSRWRAVRAARTSR
jgi:DNA-binding beta-propeller fold protein YncE